MHSSEFTNFNGRSGTTQRVASSDTMQLLTTAVAPETGKLPSGVYLSCETANVRIGFNTPTLTQGDDGVGHMLEPGMFIRIGNPVSISSLKFISASNGVAGALQVSYEYES
jgi:hypothetical protein